MADNPLPDFSYAGYGFGLAEIPTNSGTVINVTDHGAKPNDEIDDSKAVLKAITAAADVKGKVTVRFPAGRFILSDILPIERSDFVLEGAGRGPGGTELFFPRPLMMIDTSDDMAELREYLIKEDKRQREKDRNVDAYFSEYSWSGGFIRTGPKGNRPAAYLKKFDKRLPVLANGQSGKRGQRKISVDKSTSVKAGDVIQLQWYPVNGKNSAIIDSIYGDTDLKVGSHHWSFPNRPLVTQGTRVISVSGREVTIGDPLLHDISGEQPAALAQWKHLTNVGIQNMRIAFPDSPSFGHHLERGYNGIYLTGVFDGWVRDVSFHNADAGILTYDSASVTLRDLEFGGNRKGHYGAHVGNAHNVLVSDIVVTNPLVHSLTVNTQSTKAVYRRALVTTDAVLDQHAGANHQNLFDDVTVYIAAKPGKNGPSYNLWDGSGAGYWQPGHGRFNTSWNIKVIVESGALPSETVQLNAPAEGPDARIVGISGNRNFAVNYFPAPYLEGVNQRMDTVPSLYDYQLQKRKDAQ